MRDTNPAFLAAPLLLRRFLPADDAAVVALLFGDEAVVALVGEEDDIGVGDDDDVGAGGETPASVPASALAAALTSGWGSRTKPEHLVATRSARSPYLFA